jgi:preflagellin peptidase FlaK
VTASMTDLRYGIIENKLVFVFLVIALALDSVYYAVFATDLILTFVLNLAIVFLLSIILFATHSFAGGDCKMVCVIAALYPARAYLQYMEWKFTLVFAIGFAIFFGYIYLAISSVIGLVTGKFKVTNEYLKKGVLSFLKPYLTAIIYISTVNVIIFIAKIELNEWILRAAFITLAWIVCKYKIFAKPYILIPLLAVEIILAVYAGFSPISLNPLDYALVAFLLCVRLLVQNGLYQDVPADSLKKGMILSFGASLVMQGSKIAHIPAVSTEDLRSRLTVEEADAVRKWCSKKGITKVTILKKIPFAIFISLGFISYYIIWGLIA